MAIDSPTLKIDSFSKKTLGLLTNFITFIFTAECILKIFVMGFLKGKKTYLKDYFNILDFTVVIVSLLNFILDKVNNTLVNKNIKGPTFLKAMRALRALRPLKLVSKNEGMKNVVNSLLSSIPKLFNVFLVSLLFYFVFGIIGLEILMDRFSGYCSDNFSMTK